MVSLRIGHMWTHTNGKGDAVQQLQRRHEYAQTCNLSSPLCFPRNLCIPSITVDFGKYLQGWKREQTYKRINIHSNSKVQKFETTWTVVLFCMFCKKCKFWVNFPLKCIALSSHSLHSIDLLSWYSLSTSLRRFFSRARASWLPQTSSALKVTHREK